jgi:tetratricopeptide (TPR) repeat protein
MNSRTPTDRICPQRPSRRPGGGRIATLLVTSCLAWSGMALPLGAARAQSGLPDNSADTGFAALKARANIQAAQRAVAAQPNDEAAVRNLIEALARGGRNADALAEADRFVSRGTATAALRTQRGFLRRQLGDLPGAVEDFTAALKGPGLSADQRATVQAGLAEAQAAQSQGGLDRAQADLARGDFAGAATAARLILESNPGSESAMRIRVEALTAAGRTREALAEAEKFAGRAGANPLLRAQRGFLRRGFDDPHGAAEDFAAGSPKPRSPRRKPSSIAPTPP